MKRKEMIMSTNNDWVNKVIEDTIKGKKFKRRIQSGIDHLEGKKL